MKQNQKGQIFSLDFAIAMTIAVLAIGMVLNYYELSVYQNNESQRAAELEAIALNASEIILGNGNCPEAAFAAQGYKVNGCLDPNNIPFTKAQLLIPNNYSCRIVTQGNLPVADCDDQLNPAQTDVATIRRTYIDASNMTTKAEYEQCIAESGCSTQELEVKIWKA
ncbi:MAG: hypothetical protein NUV67_05810 [archaeon]|nr:hypothetical protein [archaeon]